MAILWIFSYSKCMKSFLWLAPVLTLTACSTVSVMDSGVTVSKGYSRDNAPKQIPVDLLTKPEPKVVALPKKESNLRPYTAAGKSFYPQRYVSPGTTVEGKASWYGTLYHDRKTSTGEKYNMFDFTAAHPTWPLPSFARVTNQQNGKSLVVKVNDRGPFVDDRVLDLSFGAAYRLGFANQGSAPVLVEYLQ